MPVDQTTLVLAVDSTQVNSAAAVLDKMAGAGNKAEAAAGKLTTASIAQGKALSGSVVPAAAKAAESLGSIEAASKKFGADSAKYIGAGTAELVATAAKADSATAAIKQMGDAAQQSGTKVQTSLATANAPAVSAPARSNVTSLFPADGGQTASGFAAVKRESIDATKSIDDYIQKLQTTVATNGMSVRETKLYELALQGATKAQLEAADAAIRLDEGYQRGVAIGNTIRTTFIAAGIAVAATAVSTLVATDAIIKQIAAYQDLSEKVGDTASNLASLQLASDVSGTSIDSIATASIRLTASLSKTDDESKAVGAGITAMGLNFDKFKKLSPVEQLDAVAKSMGNFADGSEKTAVAVAIFGRAGAEMLPFLKELGNEGERQIQLTDAQIKAADDYADAQAALTSEFRTFLKLAATEATPILSAVQTVLADIAKNETSVSTATELMKAALGGAVVIFQTIAVLGSDLGFVFLSTGREIGAMAAQLNRLAHLDFKGFSAISDAVTDDAKRARAELDKFQAKIMSIGQPAAPADTSNYSNEGRGKTKKLDISGLTPDKKRKGDGGAAREAGQLRKAALEQDLQGFRSALQAERDALALHDRLMQGEYRAGTLSLREFHDDKRATAAAAVAAQIAALDQERTRLEQHQRTVKDPSEKVQTQTKINQIGDQQEKIRVKAAGDVLLANQEEAASFKALGDAVTNYRANLLQLQGDEIGAAKLRAQAAIENAGILTKQSQRSANPITQADEAANARAINDQIKIQEAKHGTSLVNGILIQEEDRIALAQRTGAIGEMAALQQIGAVRAKAVERLEKIVAAQEAVAASRPQDYQLQIDTSRARLELDKLKAELDPLKEQFDNMFKDAGANAFEDLMNGKGLKDVLKSFGASISGEINSMVAKELSGNLFGKDGILGGAGGLFAGIFGDKSDPAKPALDTSAVTQSLATLQAAGIDPAASALLRLQQAADGASSSLGRGGPASDGIKTTGDLARFDRSQSGEQSTVALFDDAAAEASDSAALLSRNAATAASDIALLAQAAGAGNTALSLLPSIIRLISLSTASSGGGSSGGSGIIGSLISAGVSYFSGGTGDAISNDASGSLFSATGDMVRGRRASGGQVAANSLYEVNEKGPEIIEMGGRQYLMTGKDGGNVIANSALNSAPGGSSVATLLQSVSGARELVGPVSAGSMYRVNERRPELLDVAGKQYLMMGSQSGSVDANQDGGKQRPIQVTIQQSFAAGTDHRTISQAAVQSGQAVQRALARNA